MCVGGERGKGRGREGEVILVVTLDVIHVRGRYAEEVCQLSLGCMFLSSRAASHLAPVPRMEILGNET